MSRASWPLLLLAFGCTAPSPAPRVSGDAPAGKPGPAQRLELELALKHGLAAIEVGQHVEVTARLRNVSSDPVQVVLPGDGSADSLREPHIWYTATLDRGQGPTELPRAERPRCGTVDGDWHDEVVTIPPGGARTLEWIGIPSLFLTMQEPGRVALTLHYRYTAGLDVSGFDPGDMGTTPAFELTSNTLQLDRSSPFTLALLPRRPGAADPPDELDDRFQLEVWNHTAAPRGFPVVTAAEMRLHGDPAKNRPDESYRYSRDTPGPGARRVAPITVPPGGSVTTPDLAAFDFPWRSSWAADAVPGTFLVHLEGMSEPVPVNMDLVNHASPH